MVGKHCIDEPTSLALLILFHYKEKLIDIVIKLDIAF